MIWQSARAPLRHQQFRYQFAAQAVSVAGSALSPVAIAFGVLELTHSKAALGVVLAALSIPMVGMLLLGGVWGDRLPRQQVMVAASVVSAATQLTLGILLLAGWFNLPVYGALQAITGAAVAFYLPATTGLTVRTVPAEVLQQANALLSLSRSLAGSVGPLVAGLLVVTVGAGWALVVDGVSFAVCAVLLLRLRLDRDPDVAVREPFITQLAQGFRAVIGRGWIASSIVVFAVTNLAMAVLFVLGPTVALDRPNGVLLWSFIVASLSTGQVIGDLLALRVRPRHPIVASRLVELGAAGLFVALAVNAPVWLVVLAAGLAGIATTFPDALWFTALQRNLPEQVLSRVSSYDWMGSLALRPVGYLAAAAIANAAGTGPALVVIATLLILTRVAGLLVPSVWTVTTDVVAPAVTEPPTATATAGTS